MKEAFKPHGDSYRVDKINYPYLYEVIKDIHDGQLPCDFIYTECYLAIASIEQGQDPEEYLDELEPDVMDYDLEEWENKYGSLYDDQREHKVEICSQLFDRVYY